MGRMSDRQRGDRQVLPFKGLWGNGDGRAQASLGYITGHNGKRGTVTHAFVGALFLTVRSPIRR